MNNKKLNFLMVVVGILTTSSVMANMTLKNPIRVFSDGGNVGNGGGTVVCRNADQTIKTVQLLDYFESTIHQGMTIDVQTIPGDWKAKAAALIARIQPKSELHYLLYSKWLSTFETERMLMTNVEMSTVPDSGYIAVPKGCAFEQAAIQRKPNYAGDPRYFINADLWTAMDDNQKAGLVLHEIIYREAIAYGHTDSIRSRYLNGMYASSEFKNMTFFDYTKVLEESHFELVDVPVAASFKGFVESYFDPTRLWQKGPDDLNVQNIRLDDQYLVLVGKCVAPGCDNFTSYRDRSVELSGGTSDFGFVLPVDLNEMKLGSTTTSISTEALPDGSSMPARSLADVRLVQNAKADLPTISLLANGATAFGVRNSHFDSLFTHELYLQKRDSDLVWSELDTANLFSTESLARGTFLAQSQQKCALAHAKFDGDQLASVQLVMDHKNCTAFEAGGTILVSEFFLNGIARVGFEPVDGIIMNYETGQAAVASGYGQWLAQNRIGIACDKTQNASCLSLNLDSQKKVTSVYVFSQGPTATSSVSFCAPMQGDQCVIGMALPLRGDQAIALYANGNPQSFIVGGTDTYTFPATSTTNSYTVKPGMIVNLNEKGSIDSVR